MIGLAYAVGATDRPLIEATIGAAFDEIVARHGEREALVVPFQQLRLTYRELAATATC